MGNIELALYPSLAPKTVENFVKLAREGFYDGTSFHRVIPGFMIQGGDPNSKNQNPSDDGHGGPGYTIDDEFTDAPHERGALSMANVGRPNSGGSQFFIVLGNAQNLDGKHTIFGRVLSGMNVVDAITEVDTDVYGRWGAKNRPIANVVIERIEISPGG
jgi:peptidyl-prolyl cis-trans isomerase B (cyclophilin B)